MSNESDSELEVLDNYVPPSERKRTPVRKRPAGRAGISGGIGMNVDIDDASPTPKRAATPKSVKKERIDAKPKNAPKIIFGLDFGTTFSGLSYACLDRLDNISVLMNLDNSNQDNPKVPSAIYYDDITGHVIWGNAAQDKVGCIEWFKLLLIDEDDLPKEVRDSGHVMIARNTLRDLGKTAQEVISDYLRGLWSHCLEKLKTEVAEATVQDSRFHVVVTMPAIWPCYARLRMREAVENAGIMDRRAGGIDDTILTFVSEPEAAALATLKGVDGRCDINAGDSFVVCDCGGGTVDLIAYNVVSTEPMLVKETVKGSGGLCGAVFVDDQFKLLLRKKLGEISDQAAATVTAQEIQSIMCDDWVKMRKLFTGDSSQGWTIKAPMSLYTAGILDVVDGWTYIHITSSDLKNVFFPVLNKIEALVLGQIQSVLNKEGRNPKYVILVGGFGRCRFLHEFLKTRTGGVELLQSQGSEPWTAICRGAVIHGMTVDKVETRFAVEVQSRQARASYGIICQEKWDIKKHIKDDKVYDKMQRTWKATNQMKWLIEEGQDITVNNKFRHNFFRLLDERPEILSTIIWKCTSSPPPSRKDETVFKYAEVKWTAKIDMSKLDAYINNRDEEFSRLDFVAEMKCSGGNTEFAILHKGKKQAAKHVSVEFHDTADI